MKKLSPFILVVFITLFSCSDEEEKSSDLQAQSEPVKLELVAMSGQMRGSQTTGDAMEWQEYFLLKNDMKFEKSKAGDVIYEPVKVSYGWSECKWF